jgi:murein L,D-transpeptidase YcbB/YkuD
MRSVGVGQPFKSSLRSVAAVIAAMVFVGACDTRRESAGEVSRNWKPVETSGVMGVPVESLLSAVQLRLNAQPPTPVSEDQWKHIKKLYKTFPSGPLWLDSKGMAQPRGGALLRALAAADSDGFRLEKYPIAAVANALTAIDKNDHPTAEQLAEADVALTSAYVALGENTLTGEIQPAGLSQDWHIRTQEERIDSALTLTLREDELGAGLTRMRPQDKGYAELRRELGRMREIVAKGGWPEVPAGRPLKPGDSDSPARLETLRQRLRVEGYLSDSNAVVAQAPDTAATRAHDSSAAPQKPAARGGAVYDKALSSAVEAFQAHHGINVDGMLGEETVKSMNLPATYRAAQIAANLERYRWLPRSLGSRYILVNVPEFKLQAYDSGQQKLEMKVIVGAEYEDRNTPVFSDSMEFVIFRPYWNVTDQIAAKEYWPKLQVDPGLLARENMEVVNDHGKQRIRQRPGPKNALGLVKFMFPNDFNIYLHDTPNDGLFDKDIRAFSHGCIRVEKPAELAQFALGWPADKVQAAMNGSNDHTEKLSRKIPVYILYFTAFVRDGQLYFGNDLYSRDQQLATEMTTAAVPSPESVRAAQVLRQMAGG